MADGFHFSALCQLLTRNFSLLFWPPMFGALVGLVGVDNEAVVHILNSRTSKDPNIKHLLHSLLKVAACLSFTFAAVHVPGKTNGIADALSCFAGILSQAPCAKKSPVLISPQLLARLSIVI